LVDPWRSNTEGPDPHDPCAALTAVAIAYTVTDSYAGAAAAATWLVGKTSLMCRLR